MIRKHMVMWCNFLFQGRIKDLFDIPVVIQSLKICFKRRENRDRTILCLLILVLVIYVFVVFSDGSVFYLYVRERFHWSLRKYTLYSSSSSVLAICGMFFALYVLNKFLKIKDIYIVLLICLTFVASSITVGLATLDWHIYLGKNLIGVVAIFMTCSFLASIIRCAGGVIGPLTRSAISRIIPPEELGTIKIYIIFLYK